MASRSRATLYGKRTVPRVLLPPAAPRSTRYHKPNIKGDLRPFCGTFDAGQAVAFDDAIEMGKRGCRTCWPAVLREDER